MTITCLATRTSQLINGQNIRNLGMISPKWYFPKWDTCVTPFPFLEEEIGKNVKSQKRWLTSRKLFSRHNRAETRELMVTWQHALDLHWIHQTKVQHQVGRWAGSPALTEELLTFDCCWEKRVSFL